MTEPQRDGGLELVDDDILKEDVKLTRAETEAKPRQVFKPSNCSDLGNAERLCKCFGDVLRYCSAWVKWLYWDGQRWAVDETGQAMRYAKDTVVSILEEAKLVRSDDERQRLVKWELLSESEHRLRAMLSLAQTERDIPVQPNQLDAHPWYLNVRNGTVDLHTGEVLNASTYDLITKMTGGPCHDELAARPTKWIEFLDQVFDGDAGLISFVQHAIGYSLTGSTQEQCLFICYGIGANGKSTFLEAIRTALGDYATTADFSTFLVQRNDSIPNDIARLAGARFVTASEAEANRRLSESTVKQLTGGDEVLARFLHREFFTFKPQFKLWLAANHRPTIRGTDHAIWRRIHLIPFEVTIPPEDQDRDLLNKLKGELPGILQWAIDGCLAWQEAGRLVAPRAVQDATAAYRGEMDTLAAFLDDHCITSPNARATAKDLYTTYKAWCEQAGEFQLSQTKFGTSLTERGFSKGRGKGGATEYRGLSVKEPADVTWES